MKKLINRFLFIAVLMLSSVSFAGTPSEKTGITRELSSEQIRLVNRLKEINSTDTKSLTRQERKTLKHEKAAVMEELTHTRGGGGVYISIGAILIIILILLLI